MRSPDPFDSVIGVDEKPPGVRYPRGPNSPEYLGQVEWAWSPMHDSIDAYYLHKGRLHWVLWFYWYDDEWEKWEWTSVGYVRRVQVSRREAAIHLLIDWWRFEKSERNLDHFHWTNETGYLRAGEWRMAGLSVWPEMAKQPPRERC